VPPESAARGDRGKALDQTEPAIAPATLALELESGANDIVRAIQRLHEANPRCAEVATLRVFGDHPLPRIASILNVSLPTVERDWRFSRAYLRHELGD
jgi:DNA-directed RNA polymerase specialized sigma24 family protein